jgi:prepilin-type N-terminal cleavage/methylation domain-containing protein
MNPRGFTLIELLAVIAIVALLAALGIPAIRIGIARAQSAKCLGNLREIGVGLNAWLADNNMTMPPLAAGRKSRDENVPVIDTVLAPYLPDARVFACPAV